MVGEFVVGDSVGGGVPDISSLVVGAGVFPGSGAGDGSGDVDGSGGVAGVGLGVGLGYGFREIGGSHFFFVGAGVEEGGADVVGLGVHFIIPILPLFFSVSLYSSRRRTPSCCLPNVRGRTPSAVETQRSATLASRTVLALLRRHAMVYRGQLFGGRDVPVCLWALGGPCLALFAFFTSLVTGIPHAFCLCFVQSHRSVGVSEHFCRGSLVC